MSLPFWFKLSRVFCVQGSTLPSRQKYTSCSSNNLGKKPTQFRICPDSLPPTVTDAGLRGQRTIRPRFEAIFPCSRRGLISFTRAQPPRDNLHTDASDLTVTFTIGVELFLRSIYTVKNPFCRQISVLRQLRRCVSANQTELCNLALQNLVDAQFQIFSPATKGGGCSGVLPSRAKYTLGVK